MTFMEVERSVYQYFEWLCQISLRWPSLYILVILLICTSTCVCVCVYIRRCECMLMCLCVCDCVCIVCVRAKLSPSNTLFKDLSFVCSQLVCVMECTLIN